MLPERLSTDLTSLTEQQDRLAVVIEFVVAPDGGLKSSDVYGAMVNNKAKLAYNSVGAWLDGQGPLPPAAAAVPGMDGQLRMQDGVAQALDELRAQHGALGFETIEVETVFDGDTLHEVRPQRPNRAKSLIANLMIAANGVTARFLDARRVAVAAPGGEVARALGSHPRARGAAGRQAARPTPTRSRSPRFSSAASRRIRQTLPRPVDQRHPPARPRRVRGRSAGRRAARALRSRRPRLLAFDRAEPAVSRTW